jgi:hypothetical protein
MNRVLVGVLVAVLAVAGCSTRTGGVPVPATTVESETEEPAGTAADYLGDLAEFDPCSVTAPEVFDGFGDAEWGAVDSLDYCNVMVSLDGGGQVLLSIGQLDDLIEHPNAPEIEQLDSGLTIAQPSDDATLCTQLLVFTDKVSLEVTGAVVEGEAPQLCSVVSTGMAEVARVVEAGEVGRRDPPDKSLQPIDPCTLLTDETVTAQPGMSGAERYEPPGRHVCRWSASPGPQAMTVRLLFTAGLPPSTSQPGSAAQPIAGREAVITPLPEVGSVSYCLIDSPHLEFEAPEQDGLVEIASVWVRAAQGQVDLACQVATALATEVWPLLPSP